MKSVLFGILVSLGVIVIYPVLARDVYVKPHITKDGTYVEGHHRSGPNGTKMDNYSTEGNYNPYSGEVGKRDPYAIEPATPRQRRY